MKLHMTREHFSTKNGGRTWNVKEQFSSLEEMDKAGYPEYGWHRYKCSYCGFYHKSLKRDSDDN